MPFTLRNLKDLDDVGSNFDGAPGLEFRLATKALDLEQSGLSYQRIPPGYRFPYGHTHEKQEEMYVVVGGGGRMKLDDEIVELREWTWCAFRPARGEATRPGRRAWRSSSLARPTWATVRGTMSRAGATGGPARPLVRRRAPDRQPDASAAARLARLAHADRDLHAGGAKSQHPAAFLAAA